MRIGHLARRTGAVVETIRYYERVGLMPAPSRDAAGYRQYREVDVQRLHFLRGCRKLGFPLDEIRSLLRMAERSNEPCETVLRLAAKHLTEIREKISHLVQLEHSLRMLVDSCAGGAVRDCPILDRLTRIGDDTAQPEPDSTTPQGLTL